MEKTPESKHLIRFQDCDPFGHLNNARYIDYFMSAREDHARDHYALDIHKIAKERGIAWVVGQNQIAYFKEAALMEEVTIQSNLIHYTDKNITVECRMFDKEKTHMKAVLWATFVHINIKKGRSESHDETLVKLFENIITVAETPNFDMRVKQIRKGMMPQTVA